MSAPILETKNISKSFFGNTVLDDVCFDLRKGEVHTVLGENGAGKSTLVKILAGVYQKDKGKILVEGTETEMRNPQVAQKLGISMIFQELNLLPNLRIFENIFLGREEKRAGFLSDKNLVEESRRLLRGLNVDIPVETYIGDLEISDRQMVEIAKALSLNARIIIMDEPTSSLSENEISVFFSIVRHLKNSRKVSFIFISHRLKEVSLISDRITVLRDGKKVATVDLAKEPYDEDKIINLMIGRDLGAFTARKAVSRNRGVVDVAPVLEIQGFSRQGAYEDVSFSVSRGEVLGIAGLIGSGRTEILNGIVGIDPPDRGIVLVDGKEVRIHSPRQALKLRIGYVPEDRRELGLIVELPIRENATLSILERISRFSLINRRSEGRIVAESLKALDVRMRSQEQLTKYLSGGNQQKVVIAKSLNTEPRVMLLDEPTRGIDVHAKKEIYAIIRRMVDSGMAVVIVSSELPEIFREADRIVVMHQGRVTGSFSNTSEEIQGKVSQSMFGVA